MNKIFHYPLTNQISNSDTTLAKIAKYSIVGIGLVAIVETIKNIVLIPFNLIAEFCNLENKDEKTAALKNEKKIEPLTKAVSRSTKANWAIAKWYAKWRGAALLGSAYIGLFKDGIPLIKSISTVSSPSLLGASAVLDVALSTFIVKVEKDRILSTKTNEQNSWKRIALHVAGVVTIFLLAPLEGVLIANCFSSRAPSTSK